MRTPLVPDVRLAELVASLSLATDLGLGLPQEHVLRQTVLASRLGAWAGMGEDELASVFYVSLLAWVGCVANSHELARWFHDDRQLRADSYLVDKVGFPMVRLMLGHVAAGSGPIRRMSTVGRFLQAGFRETMGTYITHCQTTGEIEDRLGLDNHVGSALSQAFDRWDGKGFPGTAGPEIELAMRIVQVADDTEVFHRIGGIDAVTAMLHSRRGTEFDPGLVDLAVKHAEDLFGELDEVDAWDEVIQGCAPLDRGVDETGLQSVLEASRITPTSSRPGTSGTPAHWPLSSSAQRRKSDSPPRTQSWSSGQH